MIEDGHFKEMKLILDFIYTKRVEYKKHSISAKSKIKVVNDNHEPTEEELQLKEKKKAILKSGKELSKRDFVVRDLETKAGFDLSQVVDLVDEEGKLEDIDEDDLIIENIKDETEEEKKARRKDRKKNKHT